MLGIIQPGMLHAPLKFNIREGKATSVGKLKLSGLNLHCNSFLCPP